MRYFTGIASVVGGRRLLLALGLLYTASGVAYPLSLGAEDLSAATDIVVVVLVGGPGLVLLYNWYRLPETDLRPEFYDTVASWCLAAITVIVGVLVLAAAGSSLGDPTLNVLVLTALASVAGLGAGRYDARARTRTRELELRNRELERTQAELEQTVSELATANERLEQFTYAASHDLQEPLRMVSSYLQLLENRHRGDLDDDAREFLDFAVGGADRMRAMVESLLQYSRVSTRGQPLEATDAETVLEGVLEDLEEQIEETDAVLTIDDLPTVTGDPDQLAIVFEHLLSNALTFHGDEPPHVQVSAERLDDEWQFSVADDGVGIDPAYHDQIFEVFESLATDDATGPRAAGGVGLALCERIVERHGGEIWVESTAGDGAVFIFTVPAVEDDQRRATAPSVTASG